MKPSIRTEADAKRVTMYLKAMIRKGFAVLQYYVADAEGMPRRVLEILCQN
ncbi:MAG TPA: hypothetical protein VMT71_11055 [Syntrophorhabdales bacterium]|nr:hypothetical protein [Syntrophorhabdales bacterium]